MKLLNRIKQLLIENSESHNKLVEYWTSVFDTYTVSTGEIVQPINKEEAVQICRTRGKELHIDHDLNIITQIHQALEDLQAKQLVLKTKEFHGKLTDEDEKLYSKLQSLVNQEKGKLQLNIDNAKGIIRQKLQEKLDNNHIVVNTDNEQENIDHWLSLLKDAYPFFRDWLSIRNADNLPHEKWIMSTIIEVYSEELQKIKQSNPLIFDKTIKSLTHKKTKNVNSPIKQTVTSDSNNQTLSPQEQVEAKEREDKAKKFAQLDILVANHNREIISTLDDEINGKLLKFLIKNKDKIQQLLLSFKHKIDTSDKVVYDYSKEFDNLELEYLEPPYRSYFQQIPLDEKPFKELTEFMDLDVIDIFDTPVLFITLFELTNGGNIDFNNLDKFVKSSDFQDSGWFNALKTKLTGEKPINVKENLQLEEDLKAYLDPSIEHEKDAIKTPGTLKYYRETIHTKYDGDILQFTKDLFTNYPYAGDITLQFLKHKKEYNKEKENFAKFRALAKKKPEIGEYDRTELNRLNEIVHIEKERIGKILRPILVQYINKCLSDETLNESRAYVVGLYGDMHRDPNGLWVASGILYKAIEGYNPDYHGLNIEHYLNTCFDDYKRQITRDKKTGKILYTNSKPATMVKNEGDNSAERPVKIIHGKIGKGNKSYNGPKRLWAINLSEQSIKEIIDVLVSLCDIQKSPYDQGDKYKEIKINKKGQPSIYKVTGVKADNLSYQYTLFPKNLEFLSQAAEAKTLLRRAIHLLQDQTQKRIKELIAQANTDKSKLEQKRNVIMELLMLVSSVLRISSLTVDSLLKSFNNTISKALQNIEEKSIYQEVLENILILIFKGQINSIFQQLEDFDFYAKKLGIKDPNPEEIMDNMVLQLIEHCANLIDYDMRQADAEIGNNNKAINVSHITPPMSPTKLPGLYMNIVNALQERLYAATLKYVAVVQPVRGYLGPNGRMMRAPTRMYRSADDHKSISNPKLNARYSRLGRKVDQALEGSAQADDPSSDAKQIAAITLVRNINRYMYNLQAGQEHYPNFDTTFRNQVDRDLKREYEKSTLTSRFGNSSFFGSELWKFYVNIYQKMYHKISGRYSNILNSIWWKDADLQAEALEVIRPILFQRYVNQAKREYAKAVEKRNEVIEKNNNANTVSVRVAPSAKYPMGTTLRLPSKSNHKPIDITKYDTAIDKADKELEDDVLNKKTDAKLEELKITFPLFLDQLRVEHVSMSSNPKDEDDDEDLQIEDKMNDWDTMAGSGLSTHVINIFENILTKPLSPVQSYLHLDKHSINFINSIIKQINVYIYNLGKPELEKQVIATAKSQIENNDSAHKNIYFSILAQKLFAYYYTREILFNRALYKHACDMEKTEHLHMEVYITKYLNGVFKNIKYKPIIYSIMEDKEEDKKLPNAISLSTIVTTFLRVFQSYLSSDVTQNIKNQITGQVKGNKEIIKRTASGELTLADNEHAIVDQDKQLSFLGIPNILKQINNQMAIDIKQKKGEEIDKGSFFVAIKTLRASTSKEYRTKNDDIKYKELSIDNIQSMEDEEKNNILNNIKFAVYTILYYINKELAAQKKESEEDAQEDLGNFNSEKTRTLIQQILNISSVNETLFYKFIELTKNLINSLYEDGVISKPYSSDYKKLTVNTDLKSKKSKVKQSNLEKLEKYAKLTYKNFEQLGVSFDAIYKDIQRELSLILTSNTEISDDVKQLINSLIKPKKPIKTFDSFTTSNDGDAPQFKLLKIIDQLKPEKIITKETIQYILDNNLLKEAKLYKSEIIRNILPKMAEKLEYKLSTITDHFNEYKICNFSNTSIALYKQNTPTEYSVYIIDKQLINNSNKDI